MQLTKRIDPWSLPDTYPWTKIFYIAADLIDNHGMPGDVAFELARTAHENYLLGVHCDQA